ncbi:MAG TPA: ATP-dependent DNA ligase [Actinomycetota bacterium]
MLFADIASTSAAVAETGSRLAKIERLVDCLRRLRQEEVAVAVAYLSGELPQGSIGVGWAALRALPPPAGGPSLELLEVDAALRRVQVTTGAGSQAARRRELDSLFGRATEQERTFLTGLLLGELRQGALEGIMVEAVAKAAGVPAMDVRRAAMLAGDLGPVAEAALTKGRQGLSRFKLTVLRPVQPMLAQSAANLGEAMTRIARDASIEWKFDGARIQIHRLGSEVRAFTRNLADMTDRAPEVVEAVSRLPLGAVVLDGEAIALHRTGQPHPFQVTMGRFGSRQEVEELRGEVPLTAFFFDCLHLDGEDLIDRPESERFEALRGVVPEDFLVPRIVSNDTENAERFFEDALARGHEGVMVKALDGPYEAGRRGASWLKVKRAKTLDLVILAAEWGHGRRQRWLSNVHLGARDPESGEFVMLGKTFKGMTDQMLDWQTKRFLELETHRDQHTVFVRPEVVVEVAFDGLQRSTRYPGGLALRFARIKGYRPDKRPEDADTIETVRALAGG